MNPYVRSINRIEFVITYACTGRCKHCSEGNHPSAGSSIDGDRAAEAVGKIAENYAIHSLMTFGGEPLLYPDAVYKIHAAAKKSGIPKRQLITNGFFSRDRKTIEAVAEKLVESGVNHILLSADAFHQETIPMESVTAFAKAVLAAGIPKLRISPAWLVSSTADNPYNRRTREILSEFAALGISACNGNVIFPEGNALTYLSDYFDLENPPINPYTEDPQNVRAICISPNGDLLGGNICQTDVLEILESYAP